MELFMRDLQCANVDKYYKMYCQDKNTYPLLKKEVDLYVYQYPLVVSKQYEALQGDFWSAMAHKIPNYIKRFVYKSTPFERYLSITMRFQFITFLQTTIRQTKEIRMYNNEHALFSVAPWTSIQYEIKSQAMDSVIHFINHYFKTNTAHERLWWFILHYSPMLSHVRMKEMSKKLRIPEDTINHVLLTLDDDIKIQRIRLQALQKRCNICFARRNLLDRELGEDMLMKKEQLYIQERREQYNQRYHKFFGKLQNITCTISHAKLSEVLAIPKGTIDSGIALLKKQCMKLKKEAHKNGIV